MIASPVPRETLWYVAKFLPSAPQVLTRLGELLDSPNTDLGDIVTVVRCDPGLTASIIRIANSAAYNPGQPFGSVEEALARIGLAEVYRLTGFAAVSQLARLNFPFYRLTGTQLRENSIYSALVLEALARRVGWKPRAAYTAGLLRSLGKVALDRLVREPVYADVRAGGLGRPLAEWEGEVLGLSNCDAAAVILEAWHFPAEIIEPIHRHYAPGEAASPQAWALNLAAGVAEEDGFALPGETSYWANRNQALAALQWSADDLAAAREVAEIHFAAVRLALA